MLGLELSCRLIAGTADERVRHALATNLSDLLRYQNMLCRYDTMALKSLDIFSVHGFPVGLVQCESNLLGIVNGNGVNVGSGGWTNIIEKYARAKSYCDAPFEVRQARPPQGDGADPRANGSASGRTGPDAIGHHPLRQLDRRCDLPPASLDAVFTDPPYFGNVQYGELMDFCYVWLRRLVGTEAEGFDRPSSRSPEELTGNATQARGLEHFADGLAGVYRAMARALKPGAPLAFTFHHNKLEPYHAVGVAILDAGLTCLATCPARPRWEGRSTSTAPAHRSSIRSSSVATQGARGDGQAFDSLDQLTQVMDSELSQLRAAGMKPTAGDIRCMVYGHLTRYAIGRLRKELGSRRADCRASGAVRQDGEGPRRLPGLDRPAGHRPPGGCQRRRTFRPASAFPSG